MKAAFHTLGCKVNQYDTQAMLELFRQAGWEIVPFQEEADIYVLNTCTVTGTGDRKSLQIARRLRREHPDSRLVLCGCLAQRRGAELLQETGATLVIGTQRRLEVVSLLAQAEREGRPICAVNPLGASTPFEPLTITAQEEHTRAALKIQEGCNHRCTYCVIPSVRGPIRSRPLEEIVRETGVLAAAGYREIVLTGIHLASWGKEWHNGQGLIDAIEAVHGVPGILRIRLGSLEPTVATEAFAARLAALPKVCPQFHLALQSGSDGVLRRMGRAYSADQYREAVAQLRRAFPRAAFTTDVLTGFPGETEEEYQETRRMITDVGFAKIHVFPYSRRAGTPADRVPDQVPKAVKEQRPRALIALGEETARRYREGWLGACAEVLVEDRSPDGAWLGYTPAYIQVELPPDSGVSQGQLVPVRLTEITREGMKGCVLA